MARPKKRKDDVIVVKKYANRRLYDTGRSSYVTLDDLSEMIREGQEFVVQDAKTAEDITQSVLTQIIVEQEAKGDAMLPQGFMKQLIQFYGDNIQSYIPDYLEQSMQNFVHHQEDLRNQLDKSIETTMRPLNTPLNMMEEISKTNMEMMNNTIKAFSPFAMFGGLGAQEIDMESMSKDEKISFLETKITEYMKELQKLKNTE
jgi:polyhydroxyalkanoate synthesis repressor PhaR